MRVVPGRIADALADVTRVATAVGREAALEALGKDARGLSRLPAPDLAARLVCADGIPEERALAVLRRAKIRVARHFTPRAWLTLVWARAELPERADALLEAARNVHGKNFVHAWVASIEGGVLRVVVVFRGPRERLVTRLRPGHELTARTVAPLACDVLKWDSRDGRVSFSLGRPARLEAWATAIGERCDGAFVDRPAYTLKALHDRGADWVKDVPLPAGVTKLQVIACESDETKRVRVRSDKALADLHEITGRACGYMRSGTIRFEVNGHDEPVDFTIELPWKVLLSDGRFEEEARRIIDALEMHAAGSLPDDVITLSPMQPEWRWVDLIGVDGFARAVEKKVLTRAPEKRPSGREHRRWGALLRAFDVPGERGAYVVGEDVAIRAFDAPADAPGWYSIDWARVAAVARSEMALEETVVADAPKELLSIGQLSAGGGKVAVFMLVRVVAAAGVVPLLAQLKLACKRVAPAILVPQGRSLGRAVAEVEVSPAVQLGVADMRWVAAKLAEECDLGEDVEPWRFATAEAPLVLSVAKNEAWYGRVLLLVTENQLAMMFALARAKTWVKSAELGKKIAPGAENPDQIVRKARMAWPDRLAESFAAAGVEMPDGLADAIILADRMRGTRLGVGAVIV
jgi:hypothetical protein